MRAIFYLLSAVIISGCASSKNKESYEVKNFDHALQRHVLVLDTTEKLEKTKQVLLSSDGRLELLNGDFYNLHVVSLPEELRPFLVSKKHIDKSTFVPYEN